MTASQKPAHAYTAAQVKPFRTPRGGGFNANLLRGGVRVAQVFDAGDGGCYRFTFASVTEQALFLATAGQFHEGHACDPHGTLQMDAFMAELTDAAETRQRIWRSIKAQHVFIAGGKVLALKRGVLTHEANRFISEKYPDAIRLFGMQQDAAVAAYEAAAGTQA